MASAACGEDEFGNLFADSHIADVHALRGFGSVRWLAEEDIDTSSDTLSRKLASDGHLTVATVDGSFANISPAQVEFDASAIHCTDHQQDSQNNVTIGNSDAKGVTPHPEDAETDSDDDLQIVLNSSQKIEGDGSAEDSEDGEDFVVLASNEVAGGREWGQDSFMPAEHGGQANLVGGEKLGAPTDEQVQSGKTSGVRSRIGYGGQAYHRRFKVKSPLDFMRAEFYLLWCRL